MDAVHKHKRIDGVQWPRLPLFYLRKYPVRDLADHLGGQFHPVKFLYLVMDIPCAHAPCIEGDYLFLNAGDIPLVFGDELRLEFPFPVPWDIDLEFPVLALYCFRRVSVSFIGCGDIAFLVLFITKGSIQFCLHKFLQDVFKAFFEKGIDICNAGNVVF